MSRFESEVVAVVAGLSSIIAGELTALSHEHWTPCYSADAMDAELKFRRERVQRLRAMRTEFEDVMHGLASEVV